MWGIKETQIDIREKYKIFHLQCKILLRVVILFNSVKFTADVNIFTLQTSKQMRHYVRGRKC